MKVPVAGSWFRPVHHFAAVIPVGALFSPPVINTFPLLSTCLCGMLGRDHVARRGKGFSGRIYSSADVIVTAGDQDATVRHRVAEGSDLTVVILPVAVKVPLEGS